MDHQILYFELHTNKWASFQLSVERSAASNYEKSEGEGKTNPFFCSVIVPQTCSKLFMPKADKELIKKHGRGVLISFLEFPAR